MTALMAAGVCLVMPYSAWGEHNTTSALRDRLWLALLLQYHVIYRLVLTLRDWRVPSEVGSIRRDWTHY